MTGDGERGGRQDRKLAATPNSSLRRASPVSALPSKSQPRPPANRRSGSMTARAVSQSRGAFRRAPGPAGQSETLPLHGPQEAERRSPSFARVCREPIPRVSDGTSWLRGGGVRARNFSRPIPRVTAPASPAPRLAFPVDAPHREQLHQRPSGGARLSLKRAERTVLALPVIDS